MCENFIKIGTVFTEIQDFNRRDFRSGFGAGRQLPLLLPRLGIITVSLPTHEIQLIFDQFTVERRAVHIVFTSHHAVVAYFNNMGRNKISRESRAATFACKSRPRKRKQYFNPKTAEQDDSGVSASAKKFKFQKEYYVPNDNSVNYRIVNFFTVFSIISNAVKCIECNGKVKFSVASERGLGFKIVLTCEKCDPQYISSCPYVGRGYEINRRFIFAMRILGVGFKGASEFCGLMDLPPFLQKSTYKLILEQLYTASKNVAEFFMKKAVREEIDENSIATGIENNTDLTVSGDGTWHKRGFTSLYGVVSLIGQYTGKVLDVLVKSAYCKVCEYYKTKKGTTEYLQQYAIHEKVCKANHKGSSGKMEVDAVIEMFRRSLKNLGVRFLNYVGDGDSKTYSGLLQAKPYGETSIIKKECIGHVQKRMGSRLRNLVKNAKVSKAAHTVKGLKSKMKQQKNVAKQPKSLGGKGRLTAKRIDKLAVYYGKAIRDNCKSTVENMKDSIWATFYHYSSTDENPCHEKCPEGVTSWCEYQRAKAKSEEKSFKHSYTAWPSDVMSAIRPIYEDLTKDDLLERCLGGYTQNSNESFNQNVWKIMPKHLPASSTTVNIAANIATCQFNEGKYGLLAVMDGFGISCGPNAHQYVVKADSERTQLSNDRAEGSTREARMIRRQRQISFHEASIEEEGVLYGPGVDDSM